MRRTGVLRVLKDFSQRDDKVVVNPNVGFDLGIVTSFRAVTLYFASASSAAPCAAQSSSAGIAPLKGTIHLQGSCREGTVELGKRAWERMGRPGHVVLLLEDDQKLIVGPVNVEE